MCDHEPVFRVKPYPCPTKLKHRLNVSAYYVGAKNETVLTNDDEPIAHCDHKPVLRVKPYACPAKLKYRLNVSAHDVGAKNETVLTNNDQRILRCVEDGAVGGGDHEPVLRVKPYFRPAKLENRLNVWTVDCAHDVGAKNETVLTNHDERVKTECNHEPVFRVKPYFRPVKLKHRSQVIGCGPVNNFCSKNETVLTNHDEFIVSCDHKPVLRVKPYSCPAKLKHRFNRCAHNVASTKQDRLANKNLNCPALAWVSVEAAAVDIDRGIGSGWGGSWWCDAVHDHLDQFLPSNFDVFAVPLGGPTGLHGVPSEADSSQ